MNDIIINDLNHINIQRVKLLLDTDRMQRKKRYLINSNKHHQIKLLNINNSENSSNEKIKKLLYYAKYDLEKSMNILAWLINAINIIIEITKPNKYGAFKVAYTYIRIIKRHYNNYFNNEVYLPVEFPSQIGQSDKLSKSVDAYVNAANCYCLQLNTFLTQSYMKIPNKNACGWISIYCCRCIRYLKIINCENYNIRINKSTGDILDTFNA